MVNQDTLLHEEIAEAVTDLGAGNVRARWSALGALYHTTLATLVELRQHLDSSDLERLHPHAAAALELLDGTAEAVVDVMSHVFAFGEDGQVLGATCDHPALPGPCPALARFRRHGLVPDVRTPLEQRVAEVLEGL